MSATLTDRYVTATVRGLDPDHPPHLNKVTRTT